MLQCRSNHVGLARPKTVLDNRWWTLARRKPSTPTTCYRVASRVINWTGEKFFRNRIGHKDFIGEICHQAKPPNLGQYDNW
jgi:hypothetical protein